MKAIIGLEDGTAFEGTSFGAEGEVIGEVVFNTQVVGYQEILTEPSYRKQIIVMGYPHVGNYGVNDNGYESGSTHASALVIKEYSRIYSNWQAKGSLDEFMKQHGVIGIEEVDTRALTIHIRDNGEMRGVVSTMDFDVRNLLKKIKENTEPQIQISNNKPARNASHSEAGGSQTVIVDIGVNKSTLLRYPGAKVLPYNTNAEKILELNPDKVIISGGPGDPRRMVGLVGEVKKLIGKVPLLAYQNGACVLALALGCTVIRMKVGHHGVNHPVVDPKTGKGEISVQNHSYGIEKLSSDTQVVHVNLNDKTMEKFQTKDGQCIGMLYFPIDERGKLPADYQYVM